MMMVFGAMAFILFLAGMWGLFLLARLTWRLGRPTTRLGRQYASLSRDASQQAHDQATNGETHGE